MLTFRFHTVVVIINNIIVPVLLRLSRATLTFDCRPTKSDCTRVLQQSTVCVWPSYYSSERKSRVRRDLRSVSRTKALSFYKRIRKNNNNNKKEIAQQLETNNEAKYLGPVIYEPDQVIVAKCSSTYGQ